MGFTHRKRHLSDCLHISGDQQLCAGTEKYISVSDSGDRDILCFLCFLQVLVGIIYLILSLIRNILVYTKHFREWHAYLFSVLVVAVGLMVNNRGFLGLLPLIATVELTLANYYARRVVFIKASLWINTVIWMIYSYLIFDFAAGIMQTVISVLGLISLLQCIRNNG